METVSILQFRRNAEGVIRRVRQGERLIMTYRGKPVMRLEPIRERRPSPDDPFFALPRQAGPRGRALTNEEIDQLICES